MSDEERSRCSTGLSIRPDLVLSSALTDFSPSHSPLGSLNFPAPEYPDPSVWMSSASGASMTEHPKRRASRSLYMNKKEYREVIEKRNKEIRQAFAALKGASKVQCMLYNFLTVAPSTGRPTDIVVTKLVPGDLKLCKGLLLCIVLSCCISGLCKLPSPCSNSNCCCIAISYPYV